MIGIMQGCHLRVVGIGRLSFFDFIENSTHFLAQLLQLLSKMVCFRHSLLVADPLYYNKFVLWWRLLLVCWLIEDELLDLVA